MTKNNTYAFRDHAIECEIIEPIEASGVVPDARAQFDVDAIADDVLDYAADATDLGKNLGDDLAEGKLELISDGDVVETEGARGLIVEVDGVVVPRGGGIGDQVRAGQRDAAGATAGSSSRWISKPGAR